MRCPNCGKTRHVYQQRDWNEAIYRCTDCDTWFLVDRMGNKYISSFEELCEMKNSYDEDEDDDDDDDDDCDYSQQVSYVWRGCPNCSKWYDGTGCSDGLVKGDWCKNPDLW